jgi:hypothetical protein
MLELEQRGAKKIILPTDMLDDGIFFVNTPPTKDTLGCPFSHPALRFVI